MIPMSYQIPFDDGFFSAVQRLNDLLFTKSAYEGFRANEKIEIFQGVFQLLLIDQNAIELLKNDSGIYIGWENDRTGKKAIKKNFRLIRK